MISVTLYGSQYHRYPETAARRHVMQENETVNASTVSDPGEPAIHWQTPAPERLCALVQSQARGGETVRRNQCRKRMFRLRLRLMRRVRV